MWYSKEYNPIQVGSIDGTDIDPHDNAITRAILSNYRPPKHLKTDPNDTLFISRLNFDTTEQSLKPFFERYGDISQVKIARNNVTGLSQGYAFVTFKDPESTKAAYKEAHEATLDDHLILVDYERSRVMKGWIPRRFGGGYGGKKESGQLRFGARDRPFRDHHGKVAMDHDQKRSNNWKYNEKHRCSHSRDHHLSREKKRHRSPSREHRHHLRSSSRDRNYSRRHESDNRYHRSDYKRKREDNDDCQYVKSSREESSSYRCRH